MQRKTCACCGERCLPAETACWACSGRQFIVADPGSEPTIQYAPVDYRTVAWSAAEAADWGEAPWWQNRTGWMAAALAAGVVVSSVAGYHLGRGAVVSRAAEPEPVVQAAAEPAAQPTWMQPAVAGLSYPAAAPAPLGATPSYGWGAPQAAAPALPMATQPVIRMPRQRRFGAGNGAGQVAAQRSTAPVEQTTELAGEATPNPPAAVIPLSQPAQTGVPPTTVVYRTHAVRPGEVVAAWSVAPVPVEPQTATDEDGGWNG